MKMIQIKKILCIALWVAGTSQAVEVWAPKTSSEAVTPETVRIVKLGMETHRDDDGAVWSIRGFNRYKTVPSETTGLLEALISSKVLTLFHDIDVDGDGDIADDSAEAHLFSMTNALTPDGPFYDTSIGSQRMFGGTVIYTANPSDPSDPFGYSEDGMNDYEEGPAYQPRRNWTLFNEVYDIYSPFRMYGLWLWDKEDFLNGGADYPVSFDSNSVLAHLVMRYHMGIEGFRWVVRNNDQFYISEEIYQYADDVPGETGGKVHQLIPTATQWAEYNPSGYQVDFDTNSASYISPDFTNITAVGYYLFKDKLISGYVGHKWYTFEARATVHRPKRPSEFMDMVEVPGSGGVQDFYLATCETPYTLWRKVYRLADNNCFTLSPRGTANFDNDGDMGSMDYPDASGDYLSHGPNEPVTDVTLHDVLLWCNALSVQETREPVYYTDVAFSNIYSEAEHSPFWIDAPSSAPTIYVKWNADGFRLPTPKEWERAHVAGSQTYTASDGWIGSNASNTTHAVGGMATNSLGLYDMAGNVWEWVWAFGDSLDLTANSDLLALGGSLHYPANPINYSASAYGDEPYDGNYNIGLRLVRREAGTADPDTGTSISGTIPKWNIAVSDQNAPIPARQLSAPLSSPWLSQKDIPARDYAMGLTEVTFAEWKPVYDWAKANGYKFDYDGDLGSMDYWGWGTNWVPTAHGPNEPAAGMTRYDAMTWLNALSELEGLTPVYTNAAGSAITESYIYRPLQMTLGEGKDANVMAHAAMLVWPGYGIKTAADGYRLPDDDEFYYVAHAGGSSKYPWGTDVTEMTNYAWVIDNSGLSTRDVGLLETNAWGFYDMLGNVNEMSEASEGKLSYLSRQRLGLGFFDLSGGYPKTMGRGTWSGLCYPDVGLRVLRQNATAPFAWNMEVAPLWLAENQLVDFDELSLVADFAFDPADFDNLTGKVHRGDLGRSGVFNATGVTQSPQQRWKFQTGGPVKSSPVVVDGVVYFGSYDGFVYAVDVSTGSLVWSNQTGGRVSGSAAVVSNAVFIAGENGNLYSFDATTGNTNWVVQVDEKAWAIAGSPAVAYGAVFIGGGGRYGAEAVSMSARYLYGFDIQTSAEIWKSASTGPQGFAGIAMDTNTIYAGIGGSMYGAFDLTTGAKNWSQNNGKQNRQFMSMSVVDGMVWIPGTIRGSVSSHTSGGHLNWLTTTLAHNDDDGNFEMNSGGLFGYEMFTDLAIAHGRVYAGCNDGQLHTFDQATGARGWTFPTGGKVQSSPAVAGDLVYFGSWDGRVYAVNATTGNSVWSYDLGERTVSAPWPADGTLTIGCDDGAVYCLEEGEAEADTDSDGLPDWWETQYFGGATNANPTATASNGVNTVEQTYIAGLDPTDPESRFIISTIDPLQWNTASGRVYNIYWTSNLLSSFQTLESNVPWTGNVFTDSTHSAEKQGFYKIDVRLEL